MSTDAERLDALWAGYARRVHAYALRHVDPDTAAEVLSDTFLVAWRRIAEVPADPLPWLLVVARNTIRNATRTTIRQRSLTQALTRVAELTRPVTAAAEEVALEREAMLRALATLTATEREALLLTAWDGLTAAEAARVAGCTAGTFQVRLHRARRRMRAAYDGDGEPAEARSLPAARRGAPPATRDAVGATAYSVEGD